MRTPGNGAGPAPRISNVASRIARLITGPGTPRRPRASTPFASSQSTELFKHHHALGRHATARRRERTKTGGHEYRTRTNKPIPSQTWQKHKRAQPYAKLAQCRRLVSRLRCSPRCVCSRLRRVGVMLRVVVCFSRLARRWRAFRQLSHCCLHLSRFGRTFVAFCHLLSHFFAILSHFCHFFVALLSHSCRTFVAL